MTDPVRAGTRQRERPLISLVIPIYNEEDNIPRLLLTLQALAKSLEKRYSFEFVFTDNCSTDNGFELLRQASKTDKRIRAFRFSRNFGFQRSILTGYMKARGDAAIQLDADLQDPPDLIPVFLEKWEEGYDVVYGVRQRRQESFVLNIARKAYYRFISIISSSTIPPDAGDFRLISRRVLNVLHQIEGAVPYIRGTISEIGFPQIGVPYYRSRREAGKSKFPLANLLKFGLDGIIHQSTLPLQLAGLVGATIFLISVIAIAVYFVRYAIYGESWPSGFATLAFLILISLSMNAFFFAILGAYIARLHESAKGFPRTIIDQSIDDSESAKDDGDPQ